ncbi:hypothetical protein [Nocardia nepalensis]|uniref:hypothetical protein n=1 Tax=Nocardia nepalensis TaxID=3375448 RepID=UPI003B66E1F2
MRNKHIRAAISTATACAATGLFAIGSPGSASASAAEGCNNDVCLVAEDDGVVQVNWPTGFGPITIHGAIWGQDFTTNTQTETLDNRTYRGYFKLNRPYRTGETICGQIWRHWPDGLNTEYISVGLPCVRIS